MSSSLAILHINTRLQEGVLVHPMLSIIVTVQRYNSVMKQHDNKHSQQLQRHLEHCQRVYNQMKDDGSWPWQDQPDSTLSEDLVESGDTPDIV